LSYVVVAIAAYAIFEELLGIGVWRNVLASMVSICALLPFARQLSAKTALLVVFIVQVATPLIVGITGLTLLVGAPLEKVLPVLPEIAAYGAISWALAAATFLSVRLLMMRRDSRLVQNRWRI
jgi:hypothetical protein